MTRVVKKSYVCVLLSTALFLLTGCRPENIKTEDLKPVLKIDESSLDLGEVYRTDIYTVSLVIENISDQQVEVSGIRGGCTCLSISPGNFTLRPSCSKSIELTLDLSEKIGSFNVDFSATVNRSAFLQTWRLSGFAKDIVAMRETPVTFTSWGLPGEEVYSDELVILNRDLTNIDLSISPPNAAISGKLDGRHLLLSCSQAHGCPVGKTRLMIHLRGKTPGGELIKTAFPCFVHNTRPCRCLPAQVHFGSTIEGKMASESVNLDFKYLCHGLTVSSDLPEVDVVVEIMSVPFKYAKLVCKISTPLSGLRSGTIVCKAKYENANVNFTIPVTYNGGPVK